MFSLLIFVLQVLCFTVLLIALHRLSEQYGLTPLVFFIAGLVGIVNILELNLFFIEPFAGVVLRPGGHVYAPIILSAILLLYVVNGTYTARIIVFGITGINLLTLTMLIFLLAYLSLVSPETRLIGGLSGGQVFNAVFLRGMIASTVAFFVDMFVIIIVYQGVRNKLTWLPEWVAPGIALIVALWTDILLYNVGAFVGTDRLVFQIPGDAAIKTAAGLLVWPLIAYYLLRIAPRLSLYQGSDGRSVFEVVTFSQSANNAAIQSLQRDLNTSRAIYEQLTLHIEEIFWLIDTERKHFIYLSPAFERITQLTADPFYHHPDALCEHLHEDDRQTIQAAGLIPFLIGNPLAELRIRRADGTVCWLQNRSFPITTDGGAAPRYAGIMEDITDQKRSTEQALQLAIADEKMRVLHDFIRDASHDLKTPLSAMMVKIGLLERTIEDDKRALIQDELRERALHLSNLIDELFLLSRLQGDSDEQQQAVDFNALVREAQQQAAPLAQQKGLLITLDLTDSDTTLIGYREQLVRAIANLIGNAIRYTPSGQITIRTAHDDAWLVFSVQDTGIGISAEGLERIFDRFYRTTRARRMDTGGTGLGLAITQAVIERHRGEISVESAINIGSTFIVRLPKKPPQTDQDQQASTQPIPVTNDPPVPKNFVKRDG